MFKVSTQFKRFPKIGRIWSGRSSLSCHVSMSGYTRMLIQCTPQLVKTQMGEWQIAASHEIPQSTREHWALKSWLLILIWENTTLLKSINGPSLSKLRNDVICQLYRWSLLKHACRTFLGRFFYPHSFQNQNIFKFTLYPVKYNILLQCITIS